MDEFESTPPVSTYALGFLISELAPIEHTKAEEQWDVNIYAREDIKNDLTEVYDKVNKLLKSITTYLGSDYPLKKLDIIALPGLSAVKPIDNWGLIIFK